MGKSELTRQKITETALASFRERGYEQTTLRLIAGEAGISVGNAYYYFPTKNHLVQELYLRVQTEHRQNVAAALRSTTDFASRLEIALLAGLDALAPYHDSAPGFLQAAISPTSAVNPFGPDSAAPREMAIALFRDVVDGSSNTIPAALREQLPELLWMAFMGLALYWVYDASPDQRRSRRLASRASRLLGSLIPLTRLPFVKGPLAELLDMVREARL
ncbi:TetR/AcrR family transcriptional regulator [Galbitalea soli]|uniref:TetR/AcrR family transcriptional regulator n=1 Tax=Galbitalea soli TaxID=1268042 RepID=A0A7C9TPR3_9MICO|nr:TetR/AcrR family transcriptional regulator [Galbitalea soli]NEM90260.1 TetR/AcrR family transcriptional regulator [Galbitalea soli]NYJ30968.1 AcrR family transcriptional regulator [Galbitalea soli]